MGYRLKLLGQGSLRRQTKVEAFPGIEHIKIPFARKDALTLLGVKRCCVYLYVWRTTPWLRAPIALAETFGLVPSTLVAAHHHP